MKIELSIEGFEIHELEEKYFLKSIKLNEVKFKSDFAVVILEFFNTTDLDNNWQKINNVLSQGLSKYLVDDFKKWNVYLLYVVNEKVDKGLKYKIENNTFFSRKILVDSYESELSEIAVEKLINTNILFKDIEEFVARPPIHDYSVGLVSFNEYSSENILSDEEIEQKLVTIKDSL